MLVSNTETTMSLSKETSLITSLTARSNSDKSPKRTSVSRESIRVREKLKKKAEITLLLRVHNILFNLFAYLSQLLLSILLLALIIMYIKYRRISKVNVLVPSNRNISFYFSWFFDNFRHFENRVLKYASISTSFQGYRSVIIFHRILLTLYICFMLVTSRHQKFEYSAKASNCRNRIKAVTDRFAFIRAHQYHQPDPKTNTMTDSKFASSTVLHCV